MQNRSLKHKFIFIFLLLFFVVAGLSIWLTISTSGEYQQEVNQKLNLDIARHIVAETALLKNNQIDQTQLKNLFHQLMVFNPSIELYLLNPTGEILAYSAPEGVIKRDRVSMKPVKTFLAKQKNLPLKGDDPRHFSRQKVFSVAPIMQAGKITGYLYIILDSQQLESVMHRVKGSHILRLGVIALLIGLIFAFLVGYALFNWMMNRLKRLSHSIREYEIANSHSFIPNQKLEKGDEIDQLTNSFRRMAGTIDSQLDEIRSKDISRRELVANVSHDLRTPLATLRGYIETLALDQPGISEKQRQEYLSIALKHCTHLSSLVDNLFELARYDAQEIHPEFEIFNLSELIQDCLAKFHLKARQKNITLSIDTQRSPPFVYADIRLIERVFENLIENALRHTRAGGLVSVILLPSGDQVEVEVRDSGEGIDATDLPHIFERFYQQEKSRSSPSNSGLGLAIVKRIIELHRGKITVNSQPDQGTKFLFSLPIASSKL